MQVLIIVAVSVRRRKDQRLLRFDTKKKGLIIISAQICCVEERIDKCSDSLRGRKDSYCNCSRFVACKREVKTAQNLFLASITKSLSGFSFEDDFQPLLVKICAIHAVNLIPGRLRVQESRNYPQP